MFDWKPLDDDDTWLRLKRPTFTPILHAVWFSYFISDAGLFY